MADPARPHRQPDRHREGLLPRALDRPPEPRPSRHRPRPRAPRRAALGPGLPRRARSPAAAPPALRALHRALLRQPARERPRRPRRRARARRPDRPRPRRLDRGRGRLPLAPWSTASCRRPSPRTSSALAALTGRARPLAGACTSRSASGWSRTLRRRRPPRPRRRRRPARRGRHPLRADEAPHAQRHPLLARLPRLPRRPRDDRRHRRRPGLRRASCRHLWRAEIIPTLAPPPGEDLAAYADALLRALRQPGDPPPHLADRHGRLQKLPQRILGTLADNRAAGRPSPGLDARRRRLDALRRRRRRARARRSTSATRWPPA